MMTTSDFLNEIEYAAQNLIAMIWEERKRLTELEDQIASLSKVVAHNYRQAESVALNAEDPDEVAMAAGMHWNNYFGDDKDLYEKSKAKESLDDQIVAHAFSVESLAASLLQYAKQSISLAHSGLANCPAGRPIGSQELKIVIWQGRNQAIHWEEGKFTAPVEQCFKTLAKDVDPIFADYTKRNMAFDVVSLLGWHDFTDFGRDLLSLS